MLKKLLVIILLVLTNFNVIAEETKNPLLKENFQVYVPADESYVINWPALGTTPRTLPTINQYQEQDGCYVACYSRQSNNSVYTVGDGIYVMGLIRVQGSYSDRNCIPTGFEGQNISVKNYFVNLCETHLPKSCIGAICWAGPDTGGFGLP
jgi:hypothetical protein